MTAAEIKNLLDRVNAGQLDGLTPEQIDALASAVDDSPEHAATLSAAHPPALAARFSASIAMPTTDEWATMYARIETAAVPRRRGAPGIFRLWRVAAPFAAAAACVLAVSLFSSLSKPAQADLIALDADVEIESMEVGEGSSSIIVNSADDEHFAVIWVVDDGPSTEGEVVSEPPALMVGAPE